MPEPESGRFALVKTTLLDFPGMVACAVFLPGCHLRCPYCQNPAFVDRSREDSSIVLSDDIHSFRDFIDRRSQRLGGIVFSGGEALLHPLLPELIKIARKKKLLVKLDSAGLLPDKLGALLERSLLDYVAIDLKTSPHRYTELGRPHSGTESVQSSQTLLKQSLAKLDRSGIPYEVRSTFVPTLVEPADLKNMAQIAALAPIWVWQPYRKGDTLDPAWGNLDGLDEEALKELAKGFSEAGNIVVR